jgi:hypothetical protein
MLHHVHVYDGIARVKPANFSNCVFAMEASASGKLPAITVLLSIAGSNGRHESPHRCMIRVTPRYYHGFGKTNLPPFSCICTPHYYDAKHLLNPPNSWLF